jgi:hypothetical protein
MNDGPRKTIWLKLALFAAVTSFCFSALALEATHFYNIQTAIDSITQDDLLQGHRPLAIEAPQVLYHWLSVKSLKRMFPQGPCVEQMPMKSLGSESYPTKFSVYARAFKDTSGLFAWNNPVGATIGGGSEVYGEGEALLAMKIRRNVKVGLIVKSNYVRKDNVQLSDPSLRSQYDIILHINGNLWRSGGFDVDLAEWIIVNPDAVTSFSVDPEKNILEIQKYAVAMAKLGPRKVGDGPTKIETVAGPQHTIFAQVALMDNAYLKSRIAKLRSSSVQIPMQLRTGWHEIGLSTEACRQ